MGFSFEYGCEGVGRNYTGEIINAVNRVVASRGSPEFGPAVREASRLIRCSGCGTVEPSQAYWIIQLEIVLDGELKERRESI